MDGSEEYVDDPAQGDDAGEPTAKKQKGGEAVCKKVFQHKWVQMEQFKGWLEPVASDKYAARCRCCGMNLNCGKSDLDRHAKTSKHLKNAKSFAYTTPANLVLARKSAAQVHEEDIKSFEVQLATFFAEHNVAFLAADHLVQVLKNGIKDSNIVKDMTLGARKCTAVVENVVAKVETEELVTALKVSPFSILIDESTDVSNKKNMCILAR